MGLTHVAMRKLGFLFDIPCGLYYISVFLGRHKGATSVWFCAAMCVVVSRWILPQLQRAEEREVEEKRGRGSKARQLRPQPSRQAAANQRVTLPNRAIH